MPTVNEKHAIDASGMPCPDSLMSLIGAIREAKVGNVIEVRSSDKGSRADIQAWIRKAEHELVAVVEEADGARFLVRKAW